MTILLWTLGTLAGLVVIVAVVGAALPKDHLAARRVRIPTTPSRRGAAASARWSSWTIEIAPDENGSLVTVTEKGEVGNPVFRFLSRFVFGHTAVS